MCVVALVLACAVAQSSTAGMAASSSTVVGATVPSATEVDIANCQTGQAGRTLLGIVLPGSTVASTLDCSVRFGSSNDSSMLRLFQTDGWSTAMAQDTFGSAGSGATSTIDGFTSSTATTWWAVGNGSTVRYTSDSGSTWANRNGGIAGVNLNDVDYVSGGAGSEVLVATGWTGTDTVAFRSTNGGVAWAVPAGLPGAASGIQVTNVSIRPSGIGWMVGGTPYLTQATGKIYKTTDAGASWTDVTPACAATGGFFDVEAWSDTVAVAVGYQGKVCSTSDGTNWIEPAISGAVGQMVRDISMVSAQEWWIVGHSDTVLHTTDAGATWVNRPTGKGEHIWGVHATSGTQVWVGGFDELLAGSTDGGTTWTTYRHVNGSGVEVREMYGIADHVFAVGASPIYVHDNPRNPVADYDDTLNRDWQTVGTTINAFGACLSSTSGGAVLDGTTWGALAGCPLTDGTHWHAVPTTSGAAAAKVASGPSASTTPTANLRFAFRTTESQPAGTYRAGITFEVLAPTA